jgi:hypothetical protein
MTPGRPDQAVGAHVRDSDPAETAARVVADDALGCSTLSQTTNPPRLAVPKFSSALSIPPSSPHCVPAAARLRAMASSSSRASSLTPAPSRSPSPAPPVQPDHFWGQDAPAAPPSPDSAGRAFLSPADDPHAQRGIPVFAPSMAEFADFEAYMNSIEPWGMASGIVKVVPPKEW